MAAGTLPLKEARHKFTERLAEKDKQLLVKDDTILQLQTKLDLKERELLKLWQERFGAKSERYIGSPDQLKLDFGDTPQSADTAKGLHQANADAEIDVPAHKRKPRKKRNESLPTHLPAAR